MVTPSSNPIPDKHADWAIDLLDPQQRPYSGDAVQAFIKQLFEQRGGYFYNDSQNNRILIFADSENKDLYLSDPTTYASLLIGTISLVIDTDMPIEEFSSSTLNVLSGKLYKASVAINTLTVTLPAITDLTKTKNIVISLTTDNNPNITFVSADNKTIKYYSNYTIEASKEYEINIMFNGSSWIIANAEIS